MVVGFFALRDQHSAAAVVDVLPLARPLPCCKMYRGQSGIVTQARPSCIMACTPTVGRSSTLTTITLV
jgi:hypothetical protein